MSLSSHCLLRFLPSINFGDSAWLSTGNFHALLGGLFTVLLGDRSGANKLYILWVIL